MFLPGKTQKKMTADPWGKKQMHVLSDGVLRRGIRRFRTALRYLDGSDAEQVRELRKGLRMMEQEKARRECPPDDRVPAGQAGGATSEAETTGESELPGEINGPVKVVPQPAGNGTPHAPDRRPAHADAERTLEEDAAGKDAAQRASSASPESEPFWRLIPYLKGTSSKIISVISEEGVIRYQSKPVKWLLGYDADMLIGQPLKAFLCPPSKKKAQKALARMAGKDEKFDCWRLQFTTASGGTFWLEGMASNFLRDPRLGGILVYWREFVG